MSGVSLHTSFLANNIADKRWQKDGDKVSWDKNLGLFYHKSYGYYYDPKEGIISSTRSHAGQIMRGTINTQNSSLVLLTALDRRRCEDIGTDLRTLSIMSPNEFRFVNAPVSEARRGRGVGAV